jgi:hypothetical protein
VSDLEKLTAAKLFELFSDVLNELRRREIVRSSNNPIADYAEYLVAKALRLKLADASTTGYDAVDDRGRRFEIKARRLTRHSNSRQLSAIRGLGDRHFDFLAGVLFNENHTVRLACLVPAEIVALVAVHRAHVNAWIMHLPDSLWRRDGVQDITAAVRAASETDVIIAVNA